MHRCFLQYEQVSDKESVVESSSVESVVETLQFEEELESEVMERRRGEIIFPFNSCVEAENDRVGRCSSEGMELVGRLPRLRGSIAGSIVWKKISEGINGYVMIGTQLGSTTDRTR